MKEWRQFAMARRAWGRNYPRTCSDGRRIPYSDHKIEPLFFPQRDRSQRLLE
jgi:hypothetical protein